MCCWLCLWIWWTEAVGTCKPPFSVKRNGAVLMLTSQKVSNLFGPSCEFRRPQTAFKMVIVAGANKTSMQLTHVCKCPCQTSVFLDVMCEHGVMILQWADHLLSNNIKGGTQVATLEHWLQKKGGGGVDHAGWRVGSET